MSVSIKKNNGSSVKRDIRYNTRDSNVIDRHGAKFAADERTWKEIFNQARAKVVLFVAPKFGISRNFAQALSERFGQVFECYLECGSCGIDRFKDCQTPKVIFMNGSEGVENLLQLEGVLPVALYTSTSCIVQNVNILNRTSKLGLTEEAVAGLIQEGCGDRLRLCEFIDRGVLFGPVFRWDPRLDSLLRDLKWENPDGELIEGAQTPMSIYYSGLSCEHAVSALPQHTPEYVGGDEYEGVDVITTLGCQPRTEAPDAACSDAEVVNASG